MSTYDDASLVMIPSGYKTGTVFSQKPMSTNGQLTFTRSNDTATRVASNGLIEKVRTNLLTYSEQFDNAAWAKTEATITANASTSPIGTTTADKIIPSTNNAAHFFLQDISLTSGIPYTKSIYAKADGYSFLQITGSSGFNTSYANFDLSNGTLGSTDGGLATITSVGNGWYRLTYTVTAIVTGSGRFLFAVVSSSSSARLAAFAGNGTSGVLLWGAQAETGDIATNYIPTTAAAVSVGPVANLPRLNYPINSDGSVGCPSLLLEPQRTNLLTYSESFNNAAWIKFSATISANVATSPDGYTNADKLIDNATLATHGADRTINITGVHTFSVFAKASESSVIALQVQQSSVTSNYALIYYDLISGQVESGDFSTSLSNGTIQEIGNGWYRCTITYTPITAGNHSVRFFLAKNIGGNKVDYVGNGTDGVFLYGAQLEAGSYPSSYVNTLAASVTRGADAVTDSTFTALPNPNFTIFFEVGDWSGSDGNNYQFRFIPSSGARSIQFRNRTDGWRWLITNDAGVSAYLNVGSTTYKKMACRYNGTNYQLFANGSAVGTPFAASDSLILTNLDYFPIGIMGVKQMLCFPTALTNQELAALTTL